MNEEKFHTVSLILNTEFTKFDYTHNIEENRYSINVLGSMSSSIFQKLIQEGIYFFYDGSNLILI